MDKLTAKYLEILSRKDCFDKICARCPVSLIPRFYNIPLRTDCLDAVKPYLRRKLLVTLVEGK
jgi:hypothetical protein